MNARLAALGCLLLAAIACGCTGEDQAGELRAAILRSRQLGAHGLGYGERSLEELSARLRPEDIPVLLSLARDRELRVGVQFALAALCEPAVGAVRDAAASGRMDSLDALDTLHLVSGYGGCPEATRERARGAGVEIELLRQAERVRAAEHGKREKDEDARMTGNAAALMQGGEAAKALARAEREEAFGRSLKAMGLTEGGPMTPQQKELTDRMYRSMVLGEPGGSSNTPSR